ncbi:hypothetical protein [Streptomyces sp. NPDC055692]|uniref:hypothetical protein n=1 Tax=Streptomyces sp. NPDC055692 TaxID=3155683 RepID=UPI00343D6004
MSALIQVCSLLGSLPPSVPADRCGREGMSRWRPDSAAGQTAYVAVLCVLIVTLLVGIAT